MDYAETTPIARERRLGELLREARLARGLELSDVAEATHVRSEYLRALEEGRYQDLPEDIYARNFLKLYAKAVGLAEGKLLELYKAERQRALAPEAPKPAPAPAKAVAKRTPKAAKPEPKAPAKPKAARRAPDLSWLPIVLLIVVFVGISLWGFRSVFFTTSRPAPAAAPTVQPAPAEAPPAPAPEMVRFSIASDPPGAEVAIDGIVLAGVTPLVDYPVSAAPSRTLRLSLPGYEPLETTVDLSSDASLSFTLTPVTAEAEEGPEAPQPPAAGSGQIAVTITETTWFEAYRSTQRNVGERLVFATLQPGASYVFDLPVYLHVGNAAGVLVSEDGGPGVPMGSSGEVVGRAFGAQ